VAPTRSAAAAGRPPSIVQLGDSIATGEGIPAGQARFAAS
jgi:hypothetical protein